MSSKSYIYYTFKNVKESHGTKHIGAFFDFDRTVLDESSPKLGIRYMWDRGEVSSSYVMKILFANWFYRKNLISEDIMARLLLSYYKRRDLSPFEQGSESYYHEVLKPHLAPNIVFRIQAHKNLDHVLVMISAGVRYLLKPVARDLGFDHLSAPTWDRRERAHRDRRTVCTAGTKAQ